MKIDTNKKNNVYAVGNALTDILAKVSDNFISNHNIEKGIMTLSAEEEQGKILHSLSKEGIETNLACGGSACNTLAGLSSLGAKSIFAGKVSTDEYGKFYKSGLADSGITCNTKSREGVSGTSLILISPDAERTMLTHLGVSISLSEKDINENEIADSMILYIEGYLWDAEDPRKACLKAMEIANKLAVPIAFTISDPFLINRFHKEFREIIRKYVDIVFCNEEEAKAYASTEDSSTAIKEMGKHAEMIFMTKGSQGSSIFANEQITEVPSIKVDAVDTNGAGDAYAAGALYALTRGLTVEQAGGIATILSAKVVSTFGPRLKENMKAEVKRYLESGKYF